MKQAEISETQIAAWGEKFAKDNLVKITVNEVAVYFSHPKISKNAWILSERFDEFYQKGKRRSAGLLIFNNCYLGGIEGQKEGKEIDPITQQNRDFILLCAELCYLGITAFYATGEDKLDFATT
jgi:hypothetical protein